MRRELFSGSLNLITGLFVYYVHKGLSREEGLYVFYHRVADRAHRGGVEKRAGYVRSYYHVRQLPQPVPLRQRR